MTLFIDMLITYTIGGILNMTTAASPIEPNNTTLTGKQARPQYALITPGVCCLSLFMCSNAWKTSINRGSTRSLKTYPCN